VRRAGHINQSARVFVAELEPLLSLMLRRRNGAFE
jgi:hypothetical protein